MSVLISGMEMPKSQVLFCIHPDGKVFADLEGNFREYKAVPVPPHGRLGDLDALCEAIVAQGDMADVVCIDLTRHIAQMFAKIVLDAPTVIEAEEGE